MSYTHPNSPSHDPRPYRHCKQCDCVLNASEDILCQECEDKELDKELNENDE